MNKKYIYLDNNATTMVAPEVVEAMIPIFGKWYANPSSIHAFGTEVGNMLSRARQKIAESINCLPTEIVFTASGSESDNLCIKGYCEANKHKGNHIITSIVEHPAVINTYKHLEQQGFEITLLPVDSEGFINSVDLEKAIRPTTILASIMHANNEIGTIQPIEELSAVCFRYNIPLHIDAVQSYLKLPIDVKKMNVSMASFSGHKIHAPKGIGFAYINSDLAVVRQTDGGSQEYKMRAGTENTAYIIGLAKAIEMFSPKDVIYIRKLQSFLINKLTKLSGIRLNGPSDLSTRVCNNINISSNFMEGELLLNELSSVGICVSTGSACSSKLTKLSPILQAISCPVEYLHGNIRISISKYTTKEEIEIFLTEIKKLLKKKQMFGLKSVR